MSYRPTQKTEERKKSQRTLILNSALKLLIEKGFLNLTIAAVAEEAEVATGTVYKYFESKTTLCTDVFKLGGELELRYVRNTVFPEGVLPGERSCKKRLLDVITMFAERALGNYRLAYAMLAEPIDPMIEVERLNYRRAFTHTLAALIDEGIEAGEFCQQDSSVTASALVGALSETMLGPMGASEPDAFSCDHQILIESIKSFSERAVSM